MKSRRFIGKAMALMAVMVFTVGLSHAATIIVSTSQNWSALTGGTGLGGIPSSVDIIIINNQATLTVNVSNAVCGSLQLGSTLSNNNGVLLFNSSSILTVSGKISFNDHGNRTNLLDMTSGGTLICQGFTVGIDGTNQFTSGTGTIELTSTNTLPSIFTSFNYLTISAGSTTLGANTTIGTLTIASGILDVKGFSATIATLTGSGTLTNSSTTASTLTGGSSNLSTTFTGSISGALGLTKTGSGTLTLGTNPVNLSTLTISEGNLTIPAGGQVTVTGATNITPAEGLTILSDVSGTGSLITSTVLGTGKAKVERYMTPGAWHIVSSPVSGQLINGFLASNGSIPTDEYFNRGMRDYNPDLNLWNDFFTNGTSGALTTGKGYCIRVRTSQDHKVNFAGTLQAGDLTVLGLTAEKWNCIGNPYTSAIKINSEIAALAFLDVNSTKLDPSYGAIYIWDQPDASNGIADKYTIVSNASSSYEVQQGQAFMVKMTATATSLSFTNAMQSHNTGLELKSTDGIWPTIKLTAMADSITSSTIIAFHEGMTPGLDPTYDAGLLKGGAFVEVYTRLVEDNGIPFDIQALPADYASTIVPVGIDCTKGGPVTFSAELLHVPSSCQVLLEDKLNKVLTDLSVHSYTTDLMDSTVSQDRFFLHTSYSTTGIDSMDGIQTLRAWTVNNLEMKISGKVTSGAIATLYDLQGRTMIVSQLQEGNLNSVPLKGLKQGVYMLRVQDNSRVQTQKVMISQ